MKYNLKIGITTAKLCYSVSFMILLALVRGVSYSGEIGAAMDANVSLLAIIFCSDTYYQEVQGNRWEVFNLLPDRNRYRTICQRLLLQIIFIAIIISLDYWVFYLQRSTAMSDQNGLLQYITAVLACSASVLFFGTLSFTMVNIVKNLWVGIGSSLFIWFILSSDAGRKLPDYISVFAYGGSNTFEISGAWIMGKVSAVIVSLLLIFINKKLIIWKSGS